MYIILYTKFPDKCKLTIENGVYTISWKSPENCRNNQRKANGHFRQASTLGQTISSPWIWKGVSKETNNKTIILPFKR